MPITQEQYDLIASANGSAAADQVADAQGGVVVSVSNPTPVANPAAPTAPSVSAPAPAPPQSITGPPDIAPTVSPDLGRKTPQQILDDLVVRWNAGEFPNADAMIEAIQAGLGLGDNRNAALEFFTELHTSGKLGTVAQPGAPQGSITGPPDIQPSPRPGGAPTPAVLGTGAGPGPAGITGGGPQSRADLFSVQEGAELRRRLIADAFGANLSPLAGRAASANLGDFLNIDPFTEFTSPQQTLGQRFSSFAGGNRPSGAMLGETLNQLVASAGDPDSNFLDFVPDFQTAARLGIAPGFADVNPRLRRRATERTLGDFATRRAQQPENFQEASPENLALQLEAFRRRGF